MILECDPVCDVVDVRASADELDRLARVVAEGKGNLRFEPVPDRGALAGVDVRTGAGPGVLIHIDHERQLLVIDGDAEARALLADELRGMAAAEDGGHLHIEYYAEFGYLAEGSVSLVVNSPHGGMPRR
ncbi:hypothetical protein [Streptomyces sp. NPDC059957]|uniref:Imm32 family immunity protein n=1 Tax=unclassified Streptomyces TaxID=2593676 RepID=UPI003666745F